MENFLLYILRSGLYIGIFYAFFLLVMRKTTFFRLNRILLLAGTVICLVLPLLRVRTEINLIAVGPMSAGEISGEASEAVATAAGFSWGPVLAVAFFAGTAIAVVCAVLSIARMFRITRGGERTIIDGFRTIITASCQPSFSFARTIVIGREDLESNPAIFTHEKMHVKCCHCLDLFFFTLLLLLYWWNPLVWITRTELCLLHEYEADEGVLAQGVEARQYQLLLVRKAVGNERFIMASGFQHSKLKNRITMMLKEKTAGSRRWSYLAIIPCLALAVYACNPAKVLETEPEADRLVVSLGALLHDADDHKLFQTENNANARRFLEAQGIGRDLADRICKAVNSVSFSKNRGKHPETIEGRIIQDADRLDAIGAIGIARTFAYGGKHGRTPEGSIAHFHEKLLLLKDLMNTEKAKELAESRHAFMELFLKEWEQEIG